jgi:hypothetical protein
VPGFQSRRTIVACPTGKRAIGGGVESYGSLAGSFPGAAYPTIFGDSWVGDVYNANAYTTFYAVFAICAFVQ